MVSPPSTPSGETFPELAERFERSDESLRVWLAEPGAPKPTGRRATSRRAAAVYDADEVAAFLRATGRLPEPAPAGSVEDPLMTLREAAAYAGVGYSTARAYVARTEWPAADVPRHESEDGKARWRRSTIDAARAARSRMS